MRIHEEHERITSESYIHRSTTSDSSNSYTKPQDTPSSKPMSPELRNSPRHQTTTFPVSTVDSTKSSILSETLGAYGQVDLSRNPSRAAQYPGQSQGAHLNADGSLTLQLPPIKQQSTNNRENRPIDLQNNQPYLTKSHPYNNTFQQLLPTPPSYSEMARQEKVYMPTTESYLEMQPRQYDKFAEVVSNSGDTVEFAQNMGSYLDNKIPACAWFGMMSVTCLIGFLILLIGAFNIPFCNVQPMIPIWLLVLGVLIIISSCVRIYAAIPMPSGRRRNLPQPSRANRLSTDLCIKGTELIMFLAIIIWIILGCVWVYGSKWYVHFDESMFEEHYCDQSLYWTAFSVCTGALVCVGLIVVAILIIMMGGALRDN